MTERIANYISNFACSCGRDWFAEHNKLEATGICPGCGSTCNATETVDLVQGDKRYSRKKRALRRRKALFGV